MKPIQNPPPPSIGPNSNDDAVVNLQDALLLLLEKERLRVPDDQRRDLEERLRREREGQVYGTGTGNVVNVFRQQFQLGAGEIVDERTADALNRVLRELGAFDGAPAASSRRTVAGQVVQTDDSPFKGVVILFEENGEGSLHLGEDAIDPEGRYAISYTLPDGPDGAKLRVAAFDRDGQRRAEHREATSRSRSSIHGRGEGKTFRVSGKVASDSRAGVGGLGVVVVDKNVGGD